MLIFRKKQPFRNSCGKIVFLSGAFNVTAAKKKKILDEMGKDTLRKPFELELFYPLQFQVRPAQSPYFKEQHKWPPYPTIKKEKERKKSLIWTIYGKYKINVYFEVLVSM